MIVTGRKPTRPVMRALKTQKKKRRASRCVCVCVKDNHTAQRAHSTTEWPAASCVCSFECMHACPSVCKDWVRASERSSAPMSNPAGEFKMLNSEMMISSTELFMSCCRLLPAAKIRSSGLHRTGTNTESPNCERLVSSVCREWSGAAEVQRSSHLFAHRDRTTARNVWPWMNNLTDVLSLSLF